MMLFDVEHRPLKVKEHSVGYSGNIPSNPKIGGCSFYWLAAWVSGAPGKACWAEIFLKPESKLKEFQA